MQSEFAEDAELAKEYLESANAKDLYELYCKRCQQLDDFGGTLLTMAELYSGKGNRDFARHAPDAVASMERVALAAIDLAKAFTSKDKP